MGKEILVKLDQVSLTTSKGSVRGHEVLIDRPEAKGGMDKGAMGGELLLISLGGCFFSNLLEAVRTREAPIQNIHIEIAGNLESDPSRYTAIEMRISAETENRDLLEKLVTISERSCIVANTLRNAVDLSITIVKPAS